MKAYIDGVIGGTIIDKDIQPPARDGGFRALGQWDITVRWGPVKSERAYKRLRAKCYELLVAALESRETTRVRFGARSGRAFVREVDEIIGLLTYSVSATLRGAGPLRQQRKRRTRS